MKGETLWKKLLSKHCMLKFKASNLQKQSAIVTEFAQAIVDSGLLACAFITSQTLVRQIFEGSTLHKQYKESPYMLLYQTAFIGIAMDLRMHNSADCVSYVCDKNARYLNILSRSYPELKKSNPMSSVFMGSCSTETDENCIPLQMADLIASEIRRAGTSWNATTPGLSSSLQVLLNGALWKVGHIDEKYLEKVRGIVDAKNPFFNSQK